MTLRRIHIYTKNALLIVFAMIVMAGATGLSYTAHYCHDRLSGVAFYTELGIQKEASCGCKEDAVIITDVIYDPNNKKFMGKSKIPIPVSYFKVLFLYGDSVCWIGSNINGMVSLITLTELNELFKLNKMNLTIK